MPGPEEATPSSVLLSHLLLVNGMTKSDKNHSCVAVSILIPEKNEGVAPALIYTSSYWIFANLFHHLDTTLKGRRSASVPVLQHESLTWDEMTNNFGKNGT